MHRRVVPISTHRVVAFNFAHDSDNKIHDDLVASRYGFRGGLVPGVADYAYMTRCALAALGAGWLDRGWAHVRFTRPIYDGDEVEARASSPLTTDESGETEVVLELYDSASNRCADGAAGIGRPVADVEIAYADLDMLSAADRPPAGCQALPIGKQLGAYDVGPFDRSDLEEIADELRDDHPIYRGQGARLHPGHLLHAANQLLVGNVALGPWIHTGSEVRHLARIDPGGAHRLRGVVADSYARRGREIAVLDLALFDAADRVVATVRHTAIVKMEE